MVTPPRLVVNLERNLYAHPQAGLKTTAWSFDMQSHRETCEKRFCELANKTASSLSQVATKCSDDHLLLLEDVESRGEVSELCSQVLLKCFHLASIGRPGWVWSVNIFARLVTKWS